MNVWHDYLAGPNGNHFPVLKVELIFPNNKSIFTQALLDSGADQCSFDIQLAEAAGINPIQYDLEDGHGAGGKFPQRKIPVTVKYNHIKIQTEACFRIVVSKGKVIQPSLLGRNDFFDAFNQVIFEQKRKRFKLK